MLPKKVVKKKNKMAPRKKTSVVEEVAGTIKPPISFKEFSKDPVKGLLFIVLNGQVIHVSPRVATTDV
jgi:hypothetical protein